MLAIALKWRKREETIKPSRRWRGIVNSDEMECWIYLIVCLGKDLGTWRVLDTVGLTNYNICI